MKISLDWIQDFTELPGELSPEEIGTQFTLSTCEVEGVERSNEHLEQVTVAQITGIEPHPEADKLNLVRFKTGDGEKQVVCGAPNVAVGQKVPFAPVGTTLPIGFTLEPKKIRGVLSEGMLCAEDELGLGEGHEGLMILDGDAALGQTLADYLKTSTDVLLDIDNKSITHRPDLWGHYGMAREFAAVFRKELKTPFDESWMQKLRKLQTKDPSPVSIQVDEKSACLGYMGLSVDNVTVKPSPQWMQNRLIACGLRPINNIVDISNYVMLELGQPNHIFDRETIRGGTIIVREMGEHHTFTTLDEVERHIIPGDTMVCDAQGPSVIGGIMGGLSSSVKEQTSSIFIEAANWVDARIRHTSTRLGLRTDSSQRFEKSLDTNQLERTIWRILELVLESCPEAKVAGSLESDGMKYTPELTIDLSEERVNSILGTNLDAAAIKKYLESLEFQVEMKSERPGSMKVTVPSFRATKDIEVDADLIEEVGRIHGYDKLIPIAPKNEITAVKLLPEKLLKRKIMDFMVYRGRALEIYSYPMVGEKLLAQADWHELNEKLILANALNPETDRMRPSLVPSLLEKAALNQKHFSSSRFFELGRSYLEDEAAFSRERHQLGIVFYSKTHSPFMELLNLLEDMFENLNLNTRIGMPDKSKPNPLLPENWLGKHPNEYLDIRIMGKTAGFISSIHPLMNRAFKIKGNLVMALVDLTDFMVHPIQDKTKYQPLPKFPGSTFDCTVLADPKTPVADIIAAARKLKMKELVDLRIADVYTPDDQPKAVTLRARFLDRDQTLSPEFISTAESRLIETLEKQGYPLKQ
ncbi:phenylalanine--tRNA ligase subunit beta [Salinispira pacifica]|uniref:Phenylalanine--tRNA ligase beta subunit n=1 Tax=Salinispira pacifica TaxID=1307761 RepID=V5WM89_9SPIO|nr:phenylalanine--tRNA ligase subunit beta [Salinispira pacifica]AHC16735.1 Phenylalanyl-tRNA synthetase beta chain [Salinispira pacifica]